MLRRFLRHKVIRDKGLLLIFPKPPIFSRLLPGTFVGNVKLLLTRFLSTSCGIRFRYGGRGHSGENTPNKLNIGVADSRRSLSALRPLQKQKRDKPRYRILPVKPKFASAWPCPPSSAAARHLLPAGKGSRTSGEVG